MTDKESPTLPAKTNPCDTCNAARNNDLRRIARCGICFYVPNKMPSKYVAEIERVGQ